MRKYFYTVHLIGLSRGIKFNSNSLSYINRQLRKFIRLNGHRLNIIIRDHQTSEIIQESSIYDDLSVFNGFYSDFNLVKNKNLFYFVNYEKNKICKQ